MRGSRHVILLVTIFVFASLTIATVPVKAIDPTVKVYVEQPLGYIPFQPVGTKFSFNIKIETHGIGDGTAAGIVAWGMDIRVDPNVLNVDLVAPPPPPFPPPPPPASVVQGNFLATYASWYGISATLLPGTSDPTTGYWDEIAEALTPNPGHGAGDYVSSTYPILVTVQMTSKNDTQPCLIDLIDVEYRDATGVWYPVTVVEDGYYGQPPTYMSETADPFDPTNPVGSRWHELYPTYSRYYDLIDWTDNTDGTLSASDQIDMVNETGWIYHYHVDKVLTTIHWTFKTPDTGTGDAEPVEPNRVPGEITNPIGTVWHQIYPEYSVEFVITSWEDNGDGVFSVSDQFDFEYFGEGVIHWAHLDSVTTDIILSQKGEPEPPASEFPWGLGLIMMIAPAIPIVYLWRTRKKEW